MPPAADVRRISNREHHLLLGATLAAIWLLVFVTFTLPGRHGTQSTQHLDWLSIAKIVSRAVAATGLSVIVLRVGPRPIQHLLRYCFAPLALFACWSVLSVAWSARPAQSLAQAGCLGVLALLAMVIALLVRDSRDVGKVLFHLAASLLAVSTVLVVAPLAGTQWGTLTRNDAGTGADGILHPTTAGSTASLGIVVLLGAFLGWRWRWTQWLCAPSVVIHGTIIYWAAARLALALTCVASFCLMVAYLPRKMKQLVTFTLAVGGLALLLASPSLRVIDDAANGVFGYIRRGQTSSQIMSLTGRADLWPLMWKSFRASPVRGHGFYVTSSTGEVRVWNERGNITAHNIVLQALTTLGIVGLVLLIWSVYSPLARFLQGDFATRDARSLRLLLLVIWMWFLGWGTLNVSFLAPFQPESAVFFVSCGLAAGWALHHRGPAPDTALTSTAGGRVDGESGAT